MRLKLNFKNLSNGSILIPGCLIFIDLSLLNNIQDPYNSVKMWVLIVFSLYACLSLLFNKNLNLLVSKKYKFSLSIMTVFVLMLFVNLLKSDVTSIGIFGTTGRNLGFLNYLCLSVILIYCLLNSSLPTLNNFYLAAAFLQTILNIHGVLQKTNLDFLKLIPVKNYSKIILTVGNPNFAGALMGLLATAGLTSMIYSTSNKVKIYLLIQNVISVLVIIWTQALQGKIVLLLGIIVISFFIIREYSRVLSNIFGFVSLICIFLVGLGVFNFGPFAKYIYKLSVTDRIYGWKAALQMFYAHPLFGVGLDRYSAYFTEFRSPKYPLIFGYGQVVNNAHNVILEFLACGGIFVGISYIVLLIYIGYRGLKLIRNSRTETRIQFVGLYAVWLGFVAQSLVSPDALSVSIWGWISGGLLVGMSVRDSRSQIGIKLKNQSFKTYFAFASLMLLIFPLVLMPLYKNEFNTHRFLNTISPSDSNLKKFYIQYAFNNFNQMWLDPEYKEQITEALAKNNYAQESLQLIDKTISSDPRNLNANIVGLLVNSNLKRYQEAIKFGEKYKKLDPYGAENLLVLENCYLAIGERKSAEALAKYIKEIAPNTDVEKRATSILKNKS
jgi:O-antigen ligase